jgi:hypothetical protein
MSIGPGTHRLGSDSAVLMVKTRKAGVAAKAGHNLEIGVTSWNATIEVGDETSIALTADPGSFFVIAGSGGVMPLGDEEKAAIEQTIGEEVLTNGTIEFRSTSVEPGAGGDTLHVRGELDLEGARHPIAFDLTSTDDGHLRGSATVKQTDWGI